MLPSRFCEPTITVRPVSRYAATSSLVKVMSLRAIRATLLAATGGAPVLRAAGGGCPLPLGTGNPLADSGQRTAAVPSCWQLVTGNGSSRGLPFSGYGRRVVGPVRGCRAEPGGG